jgi:hypothetical protein
MDNMPGTPQFSTAEFQPELRDSHSFFVRGVLFGIGGALLGLAIYAAVAIATGFVLGLVSLAVGYIIARAILMGSGGRTGRRYQIVAALLTYAAVSLAAIPIAVSQIWKIEAELRKNPATAAELRGATPVSTSAPADAPAGEEPIALLPSAGRLIVIGLSSPFLDLQEGSQGIIGLIILAVGIRIAWRMTGDAASTVAAVMTPAGPGGDKPTSLDLNR